MLSRLIEYAKDDSFVKALFDHVRNVGLAAAVITASAWMFKHAPPLPDGSIDYIAGALLGAAGVVLQWINHENLFNKLRGQQDSIWAHVFLALLYAIVITQFTRFVREGRLGA